ncbi:uncharacterized protein J3D65DRAFT_132458 [Phyllosticta citribraziliensis]|uniref:Uncharacterized protein n=1 Tax=Phyllosticta citribraziliensis TaxID=989973 RepID=A0ABR1L625_9PEZI
MRLQRCQQRTSRCNRLLGVVGRRHSILRPCQDDSFATCESAALCALGDGWRRQQRSQAPRARSRQATRTQHSAAPQVCRALNHVRGGCFGVSHRSRRVFRRRASPATWRGSPGPPVRRAPPGRAPFEELDKSRQSVVGPKIETAPTRNNRVRPRITATFSIGRAARAGVVKEKTHVGVPRLSPARCGELRESGTRHCGSAQHHGCTLCSSLCTCTDQGRSVPNLTSFQAKRRHLDGLDC